MSRPTEIHTVFKYPLDLRQMDLIYDELRQNNVDIDKDTLSFHLNSCLEEHQILFNSISGQTNRLRQYVYEEINPNNFGRLLPI